VKASARLRRRRRIQRWFDAGEYAAIEKHAQQFLRAHVEFLC